MNASTVCLGAAVVWFSYRLVVMRAKTLEREEIVVKTQKKGVRKYVTRFLKYAKGLLKYVHELLYYHLY